MDSEQYEILPHDELEALRKEVEYLKRNPLGDNKQAEDLRGSIDQLSESIHTLINLFSEVNKDMMEDFKKMTVENHFAHLSKQNETIAQGLLSVAEMVKKFHKEDKTQHQEEPTEQMQQSMPGQQPAPPGMQPQQMGGLQQPVPGQPPVVPPVGGQVPQVPIVNPEVQQEQKVPEPPHPLSLTNDMTPHQEGVKAVKDSMHKEEHKKKGLFHFGK